MVKWIVSLPAPVRHLLLVLLAAFLGWVTSDVVPALEDSGSVTGVLLAQLYVAVLAVVTPLITSYGVGAKVAHDMGARSPFDPSR